MAKTSCTADAAVRLMLKYPFWCELYYTMSIIEVIDKALCQAIWGAKESSWTLATDGRNMWVHPAFWAGLQLPHRITALAHEVAHKMLHHSTRRGQRDPEIWNIACDFAVNIILLDNGFTPIPGYWICDEKYRNWTAESIYNDLMKRIQQKPKPGGAGQGNPKPGEKPQGGKPQAGDTPGKGDGGEENEGQYEVPAAWKKVFKDIREFKGTKEERERFEEKIEQEVTKALVSAKGIGSSPIGVEMMTKFVYTPKEEKWYDHLQRYMQSLTTGEYNWATMNRRYAVLHNICAPNNMHPALGEIVIFDDTSGSCYSAAIQANAAGHFNAILAEARPRKIHLAYFDTKVYPGEEVEAGCIEFEFKPRGGGGTSFVPLFDWIEEQGIQPAVVIVLTDGMGTYPNEAPEDYPVVWAMTTSYQAPFGEHVYVK